MDRIHFYKKGGLQKDKLESLKFSYQRDYDVSYSVGESELFEYLSHDANALVYYLVDNLKLADRILLRKIKSSFDSACICLCTHKSYALDAWKMRVFDFHAHPISNQDIYDSYKEYILKDKKSSSELVIKSKDGVRKVPLKFINYFKASGNYTQINLSKDKRIFQTKQIHEFEFVTEESSTFKRLHRSYIFNLKNVRSIANQELYFFHTSKPLKLSKALESKIKKELLSI